MTEPTSEEIQERLTEIFDKYRNGNYLPSSELAVTVAKQEDRIKMVRKILESERNILSTEEKMSKDENISREYWIETCNNFTFKNLNDSFKAGYLPPTNTIQDLLSHCLDERFLIKLYGNDSFTEEDKQKIQGVSDELKLRILTFLRNGLQNPNDINYRKGLKENTQGTYEIATRKNIQTVFNSRGTDLDAVFKKYNEIISDIVNEENQSQHMYDKENQLNDVEETDVEVSETVLPNESSEIPETSETSNIEQEPLPLQNPIESQKIPENKIKKLDSDSLAALQNLGNILNSLKKRFVLTIQSKNKGLDATDAVNQFITVFDSCISDLFASLYSLGENGKNIKTICKDLIELFKFLKLFSGNETLSTIIEGGIMYSFVVILEKHNTSGIFTPNCDALFLFDTFIDSRVNNVNNKRMKILHRMRTTGSRIIIFRLNDSGKSYTKSMTKCSPKFSSIKSMSSFIVKGGRNISKRKHLKSKSNRKSKRAHKSYRVGKMLQKSKTHKRKQTRVRKHKKYTRKH